MFYHSILHKGIGIIFMATHEFTSSNNLGFSLQMQEDIALPSSARIKLVEKPHQALKKGQVRIKMLATPRSG